MIEQPDWYDRVEAKLESAIYQLKTLNNVLALIGLLLLVLLRRLW